MNLHWETVSPQVKEIFKSICSNPEFDKFYLVGGTALSLLLGHRISIDLDFFSPDEFYPTLLSELNYDYQVNLQSKNSLDININEVKVFFMYFAFPRFKELKVIDSFRLADPIDIGLMKLLALQGRMTIKDIIDLAFIDSEVIGLEELLKIFDSHFSNEKVNKLENFSNIFDEGLLTQPLPRMLKEIDINKSLAILQNKIVAHYKNS